MGRYTFYAGGRAVSGAFARWWWPSWSSTAMATGAMRRVDDERHIRDVALTLRCDDGDDDQKVQKHWAGKGSFEGSLLRNRQLPKSWLGWLSLGKNGWEPIDGTVKHRDSDLMLSTWFSSWLGRVTVPESLIAVPWNVICPAMLTLMFLAQLNRSPVVLFCSLCRRRRPSLLGQLKQPGLRRVVWWLVTDRRSVVTEERMEWLTAEHREVLLLLFHVPLPTSLTSNLGVFNWWEGVEHCVFQYLRPQPHNNMRLTPLHTMTKKRLGRTREDLIVTRVASESSGLSSVVDSLASRVPSADMIIGGGLGA